VWSLGLSSDSRRRNGEQWQRDSVGREKDWAHERERGGRQVAGMCCLLVGVPHDRLVSTCATPPRWPPTLRRIWGARQFFGPLVRERAPLGHSLFLVATPGEPMRSAPGAPLEMLLSYRISTELVVLRINLLRHFF
jgi:hypothetical protein